MSVFLQEKLVERLDRKANGALRLNKPKNELPPEPRVIGVEQQVSRGHMLVTGVTGVIWGSHQVRHRVTSGHIMSCVHQARVYRSQGSQGSYVGQVGLHKVICEVTGVTGHVCSGSDGVTYGPYVYDGAGSWVNAGYRFNRAD